MRLLLPLLSSIVACRTVEYTPWEYHPCQYDTYPLQADQPFDPARPDVTPTSALDAALEGLAIDSPVGPLVLSADTVQSVYVLTAEGASPVCISTADIRARATLEGEPGTAPLALSVRIQLEDHAIQGIQMDGNAEPGGLLEALAPFTPAPTYAYVTIEHGHRPVEWPVQSQLHLTNYVDEASVPLSFDGGSP